VRKSVQKAMANKRRQGSGEVTHYEGPPNTRLLRSDAKGTRKMRKQVIEDEWGHVPIR
jgi:hypothetical protein